MMSPSTTRTTSAATADARSWVSSTGHRGGDELQCRSRQCCAHREALARAGRQPKDPRADERMEVRRQRLARSQRQPAVSQRAAQLQRVEGIAPRQLMEAAKDRAGQHQPEPLADEGVDRSQAHRTQVDTLDRREAGRRQTVRCPVASSAREQDRDAFGMEASQGEPERRCGRRVEPLGIVEGDQDRAAVRGRGAH